MLQPWRLLDVGRYSAAWTLGAGELDSLLNNACECV
jgi:hypothetical protein